MLVGKHGVADAWPHVADMIDAACEYANGTCTARDVFDNLVSAEWELWLSMWCGGVQACAVTHMYKTHRVKVLTLKTIAGEGWEQHLQALSDIARTNGCDYLDAECARPGWEKRMPKFGFKKVYTTWRIDL